VVKTGLPELLRRELARPSWRAEPIAFSGVTDPYQPLEARTGIVRRCLEVCLEFRNPVGVVTKGVVVRRDADLLARLNQVAGARVWVSIPFADGRIARALEPGTPTPEERLETIAHLTRAGVPVGLALAPLVPRLTERGLNGLVRRAAAAGARRAFHVLLRLPAEVEAVFRERLAQALPDHAAAVLAALLRMRGGRPGEARFGERMRGRGKSYAVLEDLVRLTCRRHGLTIGERADGAELDDLLPPRVREGVQGLLFPGDERPGAGGRGHPPVGKRPLT
jgi:DNA repair photolyase